LAWLVDHAKRCSEKVLTRSALLNLSLGCHWALSPLLLGAFAAAAGRFRRCCWALSPLLLGAFAAAAGSFRRCCWELCGSQSSCFRIKLRGFAEGYPAPALRDY
jgi:hypothetical protein